MASNNPSQLVEEEYALEKYLEAKLEAKAAAKAAYERAAYERAYERAAYERAAYERAERAEERARAAAEAAAAYLEAKLEAERLIQEKQKSRKDVFTNKEKRRLTTTSGHRILNLGPTGAGKSSTAKSISWSLPVLTKEKERTVIADILHWVPKKQNHTTFTFLDLGGHVSYRHSGHFFYINSSNNISLFFHDITSSSIDDTLWWIHSGLTKAPKSEVVFVVTKIDLIEDEQERQQKIDEFKKRIEDFLEKEICRVSRIVQRMKKTGKMSARLDRFVSIQENYYRLKAKIANIIYPVSCKGKFQYTIERLQKHLMSIAQNPDTKVVLTEEDCELYLKIGVLGIPESDSGHSAPGLSTKHEDSKMGEVDVQIRKTDFLNLRTVIHYFEEILNKKGLPTDDIKNKTQEALENLHTHGLITYYPGVPILEDIVFNDIKTLIKLLETVFHHNIQEFLRFESLSDVAVELFDHSQMKFKAHTRNLEENGIMSPQLLNALLLKSKCQIKEEAVIRLLEKLEVGYPYIPDDSDREHVFIPFFVEKTIQEDELNHIKAEILNMGPKRLSLHGKICAEMEPTFFHFLIVRMYKEIHHVKGQFKMTKRWSNCFFAELAKNKTKIMFLLNENSEVEFFFQGDIKTVTQHRDLFNWLDITFQEQEKLTEIWWLGLIFDVILICTMCKWLSHDDECVIPLEDVIRDESVLPEVKCHSEKWLPRGIMLPLSKDEEMAMTQLEELHAYLATKCDDQRQHERSISKEQYGILASDDSLQKVHALLILKSDDASDLCYQCTNPVLSKLKTELEENLKVSTEMLDMFVSGEIISKGDKTIILRDVSPKGQAKRLLFQMDSHGDTAVKILIHYLEWSKHRFDNEMAQILATELANRQ